VNQLFVLFGIESWKPYVSALLLPPLPFVLLMLLGARLILPRRGLGWLVVLSSALLLGLSASSGMAGLLQKSVLKPPSALGIERLAQLKANVQAKQPVAIVVLGGGIEPFAPEYGVANLTYQSLERLRYGLWLAHETGAPVMFSGGVGWGAGDARPEAQVAAQIAAQEFGRPLKWQEDKSRDTRENAAYAVAMLKSAGINHVLLVTHGYHMARASRAFTEAAGESIRIETAPMGLSRSGANSPLAWLPTGSGMAQMRLTLHEIVGLLSGA
jgi:uncharacterized SAM-binding protein YcdF (DUF218 family)